MNPFNESKVFLKIFMKIQIISEISIIYIFLEQILIILFYQNLSILLD